MPFFREKVLQLPHFGRGKFLNEQHSELTFRFNKDWQGITCFATSFRDFDAFINLTSRLGDLYFQLKREDACLGELHRILCAGRPDEPESCIATGIVAALKRVRLIHDDFVRHRYTYYAFGKFRLYERELLRPNQ